MVDASVLNCTRSSGLRLLKAADLADILEIERTSYSFPWSAAVFADCFGPGYECWGADVGNVLAGYGVIRQILDEVHLLNLCVAPARRGQGVARLLLRHLVARARQREAQEMTLEARASNTAARALYQAEGLVEIAVRPDYYPDTHGREDAHIMRLSLR